MFLTFEQTVKEIKSGKLLHIAAEEALLGQLPKGNWIGGTTPYFIDEEGGIISHDKLFVNVMDIATDYKISLYDEDTVLNVIEDTYHNGFTLMVMPFGSKPLAVYAEKASDVDGLFLKSIVGWVSGFDLNSTGSTAKAVDGSTGMMYEDKAVALHIAIPDDKLALIGTINIFTPNVNSPEIRFLSDGGEVRDCMVGNEKVMFADYIRNNSIDTELPLVANYNGANVNTSIKNIDGDTVSFYAPVFADQTYHFANSIQSYEEEFAQILANYLNIQPIFSCNCILNFLYGKLEGKKTTPFSGAVTFGEIAYQLLNQTLVYITIV